MRYLMLALSQVDIFSLTFFALPSFNYARDEEWTNEKVSRLFLAVFTLKLV